MTTLDKIRTLHRIHGREVPALLVVLPLWATLFVLIAEELEHLTIARGRQAIRDLVEFVPREARVRLLMNLLQREEIFISPACKNVTDSLLHLESEKQKEGAKYDPSLAFSPKRSKYLHTFDAMTYPMLSLDVKRSRTVSTGSTMELHAFGS